FLPSGAPAGGRAGLILGIPAPAEMPSWDLGIGDGALFASFSLNAGRGANGSARFLSTLVQADASSLAQVRRAWAAGGPLLPGITSAPIGQPSLMTPNGLWIGSADGLIPKVNHHVNQLTPGMPGYRGWTPETIDDLIQNHSYYRQAFDRHFPDSEARAYFFQDGRHGVVNLDNGRIVQVSNANKPGWAPAPEITGPDVPVIRASRSVPRPPSMGSRVVSVIGKTGKVVQVADMAIGAPVQTYFSAQDSHRQIIEQGRSSLISPRVDSVAEGVLSGAGHLVQASTAGLVPNVFEGMRVQHYRARYLTRIDSGYWRGYYYDTRDGKLLTPVRFEPVYETFSNWWNNRHYVYDPETGAASPITSE
ncbi:MAG TPA: colicin E5-related ribonuclease, partial [Elusimicrobiota bacterium]|nr:colicin E5-related ribonuclease [Elusimicrobiota bacterium]